MDICTHMQIDFSIILTSNTLILPVQYVEYVSLDLLVISTRYGLKLALVTQFIYTTRKCRLDISPYATVIIHIFAPKQNMAWFTTS